jgi:cell division protein FtsI (penicillin-binding protein 3)
MRHRIPIVVLGLVVWAGLVGARLWQLQVRESEVYRERASRQQSRVVDLVPPRGAIYDANGVELAVSLEVESAFGVPSEIAEPHQAARRIAAVVPGVDVAELAERLAGDGEFVWVRRQLDPPVAERLRQEAIPGIHFLGEHKRYYPLRDLAAQVLGFVGVDHVGLGGLEARYEKVLAGRSASRKVFLDALRRTALVSDLQYLEPEPGLDLHLTIDAKIQHLVERELAATVEKSRGLGGLAVVLDPNSGAVLAMASYPGFDPNRYTRYSKAHRRNRVITDVYEPGSTFKMVPVAAALEANLFDPSDEIDCEMGKIYVDGVRIRDHKPFDVLTVGEIVAKSSNVGTVKIGLAVGDERLYGQMRALGFGRRAGIDLPGESGGLLPELENWPPRAGAYMSFGQGLAVSALQLVNAFAAVANGGVLHRPYLVRGIGRGDEIERLHPQPEVLGRAMSPATARSLERLLESVVAEGGTARQAQIRGYRVAGKTGTAQKVFPGQGYSYTRVIASFVGMAPARDPAIVALVAVDEPKGLTHGGSVAGPAFAAIVEPVLHHLNVPPDRTLEGAEEPWYEEPEESEEAVEESEEAPRFDLASLSSKLEGGTVAAAPLENGPEPVEIAPAEVAEGAVPDLVGLTAREAVGRAARLGLPIRLNGRGFVRRQEPLPGTPASADQPLVVWLESSVGS